MDLAEGTPGRGPASGEDPGAADECVSSSCPRCSRDGRWQGEAGSRRKTLQCVARGMLARASKANTGLQLRSVADFCSLQGLTSAPL